MSEDYQLEQHEHYRRAYDAQKVVNVYFITCDEAGTGKRIYAYVAANALLHDDLLVALRRSVIPDFAVVVQKGYGLPDEEVKEKMKSYYGFDHATAEQNRQIFGNSPTTAN